MRVALIRLAAVAALVVSATGCTDAGNTGPAANACPRYYQQTVCVWKDADYRGQFYAFSGDDYTYTNNVYPDGGGIDDEVGSVINNTDYYVVFYYNPGYGTEVSPKGGNGKVPLCLAPGKYRNDTRATWPATNAFSSHKLYTAAQFKMLNLECTDYVAASGILSTYWLSGWL